MAIDWTQPLELTDGTPVRLAVIGEFVPPSEEEGNPDNDGSYYLVRQDGKDFDREQQNENFNWSLLIVNPDGSRWDNPNSEVIVRNIPTKATEATFTLAEFKDVLRMIVAFSNQRQVAFDYDGKLRIVEPHALGTSTKDGEFLLRAYQIAGESRSGEAEGWRLFRLEKITNIRVLDTASQAPRPGYVEGDRQMAETLVELVNHA